MNDCPNADVRDQLPDLVHDRLTAAMRASVEAHVAACADCAAELALLRDLRAVRVTPTVDVASIVAALPAYRKPIRRSWVGWRAAAAITAIVAGASSVAVLKRGVPSDVNVGARASTVAVAGALPQDAPAEAPRTASVAATVNYSSTRVDSGVIEPAHAAAPTSVAGTAPRELAMGGGTLNDLDDRELASLLKDIESLDALPSVDVESTPVSPISPNSPRAP
ncbi:hypothetical protein BH09GEM1_BH09GEM1_36340 [soil metagenome]